MSTDTAAAHASASERHVVTRPRAARRTPQMAARALVPQHRRRLRVAAHHRGLLGLGAGHVPDADDVRADPQQQRRHRPDRAERRDPARGARVRPVGRLHDDAQRRHRGPLRGPDRRRRRAGGRARAGRRAAGRRASTDSSSSSWGSTRSSRTLATGSLIQALITMVTNDSRSPASSCCARRSRASRRPTSPASRCRCSTCSSSRGRSGSCWSTRPPGRRLYATGFNADAARLAGVAHRPAALPVADHVRAAGRRRRHRVRLGDRLGLARPPATRTCCRRTRPPSSARPSCAAAASTPGAP